MKRCVIHCGVALFVMAISTACSPRVTLQVDRSRIKQGEEATLKWTSKNAKTVTLNGDLVPSSGLKKVHPKQTVTYEVLAKRGQKIARDFTRIEVDIPTPAPDLSFSVDRDSIVRGDKTMLRWSSTNTETVTIAEIGQFPAVGSIEVSPKLSTIYTATAIGPGGADIKGVRVSVLEPEPLPSTPGTRNRDLSSEIGKFVKVIYFAYDSDELNQESREKLIQAALWLNRPENRTIRFRIEGHCDERGTQEYNFALGDRRANVARDFLIGLNVSPDRIETQSYGEEQPVIEGHNEDSWQLNRRDEFIYIDGGEKEVSSEQEPHLM